MLRNTIAKLRGVPSKSCAFSRLPQNSVQMTSLITLFSVPRRTYCASADAQSTEKPVPSKTHSPWTNMAQGLPMCQFAHLHDSDASQGSILRVCYNNNLTQFYLLPQEKVREQKSKESSENSERPAPVIELCDFEKRIVFSLSAGFVCRLLAVLDGTVKSNDFVTPHTEGTFSGDFEKFTFEMSGKSVPQAMKKNAGEKVPWKFTFNPGESVALEQFLKATLQETYGFSRSGSRPRKYRRPQENKQ